MHISEIEPCPLGDAYVMFRSPLERERFLGLVFRFDNYSMTVIKHDEAENARSFDLDHEAWVMLVGFPKDLKNAVVIAKAVFGFGILVYWHDTNNLARVIAKVYLNDDAKILDSVKINAGLPQKGRSWTLPCFVLKKTSVVDLPDKEAFVAEGPLHPVPPQTPHWSGPVPPAPSDATPVESSAGSAMNVDGGGPSRWMQHAAPEDPEIELALSEPQIVNTVVATDFAADQTVTGNVVTPTATERFPVFSAAKMPKTSLKSVIIGPSKPTEPMVTVVPSLPKQVHNSISVNPSSSFLRFITLLIIDHDTIIPSYFNDPDVLIHLAFILHPQLGDIALEKLGLNYMENEGDNDVSDGLPPFGA